MAEGPLRLNFHQVTSPDVELPFLVRPLVAGESLRDCEQLWFRSRSESEQSEAVAVSDVDDSQSYGARFARMDTAEPAAVRQLLRRALESRFQREGLILETHRLNFACYRPDDLIRDGVPQFLNIRRGLEFRIDDYTDSGRRHFGFFVSVRIRVNFLPSLVVDVDLRNAAVGQRVLVEGSSGRSGRLVRIDSAASVGVIETDSGEEISAPLASIRVPASPGTLSRYCRLRGEPAAALNASRVSQFASFRQDRSGQRSRRWMLDQMDYVHSWLVPFARYDELSMVWPNSAQPLRLNIRPLQLSSMRI